MRIIEDRKEWRTNTINHLVENGHNALDAIDGVKAIESYLFGFENEVIIHVQNEKQKEALKNFIESFG